MEVILREDVSGLGVRGDVVKVRDGYARNYLFPKKRYSRGTYQETRCIYSTDKAS
ncbi:MAG: hypothetical protein B6D63_01000 [Candidatus Latescibacteria bacterium 4484_7]|nr:MAG: hypothetical protein B6D63_01000 [Candidatus Latescibacteria bacterium 4484_7]